MDRLQQQIDFILEVDRLKEIFRQTYVTSGKRKENDAEHSWHLALMCLLLSEYANEEIDVLKTMSMLLVHDIIEVDAGDTYAYDAEGNVTKQKREREAADRIFGILPEDQGMRLRSLWEEFEEGATAEAKFAHVMDNMQPMLQDNYVGGKSWKEHQVEKAWILKRNAHTAQGSKELWAYMEEVIARNVEKGTIKNSVRERR